MTKAEARQYLIDHCNPYYPQGDTQWDDAMNTAIKALEESEQPGWIPWEKNTRNSMKYTLQTLYRLAYNIHGVMDAIDDDNVKRLIALLEGGQDE